MFATCSYLMCIGLIVTSGLTGNSMRIIWAQRTMKVVIGVARCCYQTTNCEGPSECNKIRKRNKGHKHKKERGKIFKNYHWGDCLLRKSERIN